MILLGLAGTAGSGKDSVADYLVQRYRFIKFSFSDALYREVTAAFDLPDESLLRDRATKEQETPLLSMTNCSDDEFADMVQGMFAPEDHTSFTPHSPRWVLQVWGTEYRRVQDPDYWIDRAEEWISTMYNFPQHPEHRPQLFVNTSVRFPNERDWIHDLEGNVWHLRREAAVPVAGHVSETPLPVLENEREIFNNYTLDYLHKGVDQLLTSSAKFVRMEPPAPMTEPQIPYDGVANRDQYEAEVAHAEQAELFDATEGRIANAHTASF